MPTRPRSPLALATVALSLVSIAAAIACSAPSSRAPAPVAGSPGAARPRLVVMVVVDQFREPYLEDLGDLFTGGLRRLLDHGLQYTRATHDHAVTETAVGHATLATGVYPMHHGIVANEWSERTPRGWLEVSNVGDSTTSILGMRSARGVSPHAMMHSGLADWMEAADPRSQVASVSAKDRGAVLPAAHARGQVYWFDARAGRFVTSTYYRSRYPAWADAFTAEVLPRYARDSVWRDEVPSAARGRSSPDSASWEGDGVHTFFPHRFTTEGRQGHFWDWFSGTPMLDAATLDYARAMVTALGLGRDDAPDFLNVSLSQTDRIGHGYGPRSREQLDNLLRLDRELGEFFAFLDRTVGADKWVVVLSADHGALLAPETLPYDGESTAGRRATAQEMAQLGTIADSAAKAPDDPATTARVAGELRRLPFVAAAYTDSALLHDAPADSFAVLERRSLYPGRAASQFSRFGVEVRYAEGWLPNVRGTGHGTPYWYDRHVPVVFMGRGIAPGRDSSRVATVDVAPTLARLVGIGTPSDLDGKALPVGNR
jgi:predicted AlkP superfamily pyrophosphatase or phosphodiesterase